MRTRLRSWLRLRSQQVVQTIAPLTRITRNPLLASRLFSRQVIGQVIRIQAIHGHLNCGYAICGGVR